MGKIEEEENGPLVAKKWYTYDKELSLPLWVCMNCDHKNNIWLPICDKCNSFDSYGWGYDKYQEVQSIELQEEYSEKIFLINQLTLHIILIV